MAFKFNEKRRLRTPDNSTFKFGRRNIPIKKVDMEDGTLAEANMDGSVSVDKDLDLNSTLGERVIKHEDEHRRQMGFDDDGEKTLTPKAAYDDVSVTWKGRKYPRKNGKVFYRTKWYNEGSDALPWEKEAIAVENK